MNQELREYVTRVGFSISLSKAQIEHLVFMHVTREAKVRWLTASSSMISTSAALQRRGLIEHRDDSASAPRGWYLSKAGELVVGLLKESGIYEDIKGDLAVWDVGGKHIPLTEALESR